MPAHYLNDLDPSMRAGRGARALNDFSDVPQSRIEAERVIRCRKIFVNGLWYADDAGSLLRQPRSHAESIFTATGNYRIELQPCNVSEHFFRTIDGLSFLARLLERVGSRRS